MMTNPVKRVALAVGATVIAVGMVPGFALAQNPDDSQGAPPRRGPGGFRGRPGPGPLGPLGPMPLGRLGLTDAQREQVKSILEAQREQTRTLMDFAFEAREALDAAITGDVLDEAVVRTRSAEVATIEADLAVARAQVHSQILQILTPEQRAGLQEMQARMKERMKNRRERRRKGQAP